VFIPGSCSDGPFSKVVLPFHDVEVVTVAGVKLTLAGDKLEDDSKGARLDVSFWVNFSEEGRILSADVGESVFG
jgi:hypothetical protein